MGKPPTALEGSIFIAGAVVQWLRDSLNIIKPLPKSRNWQVPWTVPMGHLCSGLCWFGSSPLEQKAQGTIFGLTRGSTDAHIARAALESIAYQTMDILKAMEADSGISIQELRVDGGATVNDMLMQFQADVLNTVTVRPKIVETTVMGPLIWPDWPLGIGKVPKKSKISGKPMYISTPPKSEKAIDEGIEGWYRAIKALEYWTENPYSCQNQTNTNIPSI